MRYLLISISLLCLGCGSYPKINNLQKAEVSTHRIVNPYFSDLKQDYVYKANISVYKKTFSGIFIVKKLAEDHHRVVFTTEMGNKIFDFTFYNNDFKVNYILDEMNKKMLLNILKQDFKALIENNLDVLNTFSLNDTTVFETRIDNEKHYYYIVGKRLYKIVRTGRKKEKVSFSFSEINDNIAKHISIAHKNIKFKIKLKLIN